MADDDREIVELLDVERGPQGPDREFDDDVNGEVTDPSLLEEPDSHPG